MRRLKACLSTQSVLASAILLAIPLAIYPQSTDSDSQTELIRVLRQRVDQLEKRMAEMESALAAGTSPVRANPETRPEAPREAVVHMAGPEHPMGTGTTPPGGGLKPIRPSRSPVLATLTWQPPINAEPKADLTKASSFCASDHSRASVLFSGVS
jgi:hypothetical protein